MSDTEQIDEEIDEDFIYQQMYQAIEDEIHVEFGSEDTPNLDALNLTQDEIQVIRKQGIAAFKEIMLAKFRQNNENNSNEEEGTHSPKSIQCEEGNHNESHEDNLNKERNIEDGEPVIVENHQPKAQITEQAQPVMQSNIIPEINSNLETRMDATKNERIPAGTLSDKSNAAGKINMKIGFALSLKSKFQKGETITENERLGKIPSEKILKTPYISNSIQETRCEKESNVQDITIKKELNGNSENITQKDQVKQQQEIIDQPNLEAEQANRLSLEDKTEANSDPSKKLNYSDCSQQITVADVQMKKEISNPSQEKQRENQKEQEDSKKVKVVLEENKSSERNEEVIEKNNQNKPQSDIVTVTSKEQPPEFSNGKGKNQVVEVEPVAKTPADNYTSDNHGTNLPGTKIIPQNNQQSLVTQVSFSTIVTNPIYNEQQQQYHFVSDKQSQQINTTAFNSSNFRQDVGRNGNPNQGVESKNIVTLKEKNAKTNEKPIDEQLIGDKKSLKAEAGNTIITSNSKESTENSSKHGLVIWEGDSEVSPIKKPQQQFEDSLNLSQPFQSANKTPSRQQPQQSKKQSTPVLANNVRQLQLSGVKVSQMKMLAPIGQQNTQDSEFNRQLQQIQQASVDLTQGNQHLNDECLNISNHISQLHANQKQNYNFSSPQSRGQINSNITNYSSISSNNRVSSPKKQEDVVASIYRRHQEAQDKIKKMKEEKDKREEALLTKKAVYLSKTSEKILAKKQYVKLESRSTALAKSVSEKRKQQLEEKLKATEEAELQQCTFKPELISKSINEEPFLTLDETQQNQQLQQQYQSAGSNISNSINNQRQYDEFFAKQIAWTQRKKNEIMSNQIIQMEKEKSELTFHPNINRISEDQVRNVKVEDRLLQDFERLLDKKKAMEEESQPLFRPVILPHSNQLAKQRKQKINMSNQLSNYNSTL